MADIFKDGILYMDDIHNSDIFSDILEEQEKETKLDRAEKERIKKEQEKEDKMNLIQSNSQKCFKEVLNKLKNLPEGEVLFNDENQIVCSNGYKIEIIEEDNIKKINLIIPNN